jgi:hypothetical protein
MVGPRVMPMSIRLLRVAGVMVCGDPSRLYGTGFDALLDANTEWKAIFAADRRIFMASLPLRHSAPARGSTGFGVTPASSSLAGTLSPYPVECPVVLKDGNVGLVEI